MLRFLKKIRKTNECWIWTAALDKDGYGVFRYKNKEKYKYKAHRFSYEFFIGEIPKGKLVCHTCDNPPCVNPYHLFLGTRKDNTQDMLKKGRSKLGKTYKRKEGY